MQVQVRDCIFKSPVVGHQICSSEKKVECNWGQNSLITVVVFVYNMKAFMHAKQKPF